MISPASIPVELRIIFIIRFLLEVINCCRLLITYPIRAESGKGNVCMFKLKSRWLVCSINN